LIQALATLDVNGRVARQLLAFAEKYGREKDGMTTDLEFLLLVNSRAHLARIMRRLRLIPLVTRITRITRS
jgi:CRP-like cAMP-binding protein